MDETLDLTFFLFLFSILASRVIYDAWRRSRIFYGLSEERALIASPKSLQYIELSGIRQLTIEETASGYGTIVFGQHPALWRDGSFAHNQTKHPSVPRFELIPDPARIYAEIRELQTKA